MGVYIEQSYVDERWGVPLSCPPPCCLSIFVLRDIQHVRTKHRETSEVHVTRRAALRVTCTTFEAYLGVSLPHGPGRCLSGRGEIPTRREINASRRRSLRIERLHKARPRIPHSKMNTSIRFLYSGFVVLTPPSPRVAVLQILRFCGVTSN